MTTTARILDGTALAASWLADIREQVLALAAPVHLAAVCRADNDGLRAFVKLKQRAALEAGILFSPYFFEADDEAGARTMLEFLSRDDEVHGIFVELPIPESWDRSALLALIPSEKDADALTRAPLVEAPAVAALRAAVENEGITLRGAHACVVGQGLLVGVPIARWLESEGAVVDRVDDTSAEPAAVCSQADLVVAGAGVPSLVTGEWIRQGAAVFDFGYAKKDGVFVGDVDAPSVVKKAGLVSPVPGGMGPLVVAAVLQNVLTLALHQPKR